MPGPATPSPAATTEDQEQLRGRVRELCARFPDSYGEVAGLGEGVDERVGVLTQPVPLTLKHGSEQQKKTYLPGISGATSRTP
jgi:hypothetical protein